MSVRVAVFASGGGTNLQALMDRFDATHPVARVSLVVSDRTAAGALERARHAGVATRVIPVTSRPVEAVRDETLAVLEEAGIELIALAGYLRLVPAAVVRRFRDRMLNIHPALLPAFGGKGMYGHRVHEAVLEAGCKVSGATVHYVTERYDEGHPIVQWPVPVLAGDTPESLASRVLRVEHVLYPLAVERVACTILEGIGGTTRPGARLEGQFSWSLEDAPSEAEVRRLMDMD